MNVVATASAILLGVVFLVSGASKVASRSEWDRLARDFGAPAVVRRALPWVEIVLGALLVVSLGRRAAAAAALVILAAFTAAILGHLRRDEHPDCACFGAWSSRPLGPGHVARNAALMGLSVLAML